MLEPIISYSVDNDRRFAAAVQNAIDQVGDLTVPFTLISRDFYRSERSIFDLQGPGQFPDISPRYRAAKMRRYGFVYPLLVASGQLRDSMLDPSDAKAINFIDRNGQRLVIGTSVSYGVFHQSDRPRKKIPQRKFLFIGPEAPQFATSDQMGRLERWMGIINGYVQKKLEVMGEVSGG